MAAFFQNFKKIPYSNDDKITYLTSVRNIVTRVAFEESLKTNTSAFYKYDVQDGELPEHIAEKYYGSAQRHWIVLLYNNVVDPQYDWILSSRLFNKYVDEKYSSSDYADTANTSISGISWAKNEDNVKSYFKKITRLYDTGYSFIQTTEIDQAQYANTAIYDASNTYVLNDGTAVTEILETTKQTYFEYEMEENERKRTISLLKPEFVDAVERELKRILNS